MCQALFSGLNGSGTARRETNSKTRLSLRDSRESEQGSGPWADEAVISWMGLGTKKPGLEGRF